ncbi:phosphatase PAP2 family protein [uncultured Jannaschia sp.]|uniref:phosphatase PAP2 family protein n=1 Tax=uncultured Jannaschia sp. TaxID=293347 RepID=UPI00260EF9F0|nr:phosphatase PAP2 family protein [uncultured Jannaschia sp.]
MTDRDNFRRAQAAELGWLGRADLAVAEAASDYEDYPAVRTIGAFAELADQPPLVTICIATLGAGLLRNDPRQARAGLRMILAHALATGVKTILKNSVDRSRPFKVAEDGRHEFAPGESDDGEDRSFPSGHTAGALAVARAVARQYPAASLPLTVGVLLVGGIQIPRQSHHPSDVLTGAVIGYVSELVADRLLRRVGSELRRHQQTGS